MMKKTQVMIPSTMVTKPSATQIHNQMYAQREKIEVTAKTQRIKKDRLRSLSREYSETAIIEVARCLPAKESL
jgi:ArsR family metal-binding transcriptional regulator